MSGGQRHSLVIQEQPGETALPPLLMPGALGIRRLAWGSWRHSSSSGSHEPVTTGPRANVGHVEHARPLGVDSTSPHQLRYRCRRVASAHARRIAAKRHLSDLWPFSGAMGLRRSISCW
jgi:hypothetical protein